MPRIDFNQRVTLHDQTECTRLNDVSILVIVMGGILQFVADDDLATIDLADSTANQLFNKTEEASALVEEGSVAAIKLGVYRDIILADANYTSKLIRVDYASGQNLTIHNDAEDYNIVTLRNGKESKYLDTEGAFYCVYNGTIYKYVRVIVTFIDGCSFITTASSSSSSSRSGSSSSSGGGFFAQLFAAIAAFFKSLFSFGK